NTVPAPAMLGGESNVRLRPSGATTMFCGPEAGPASAPGNWIESIVGVNVTSGLSTMVAVTDCPMVGLGLLNVTSTLSNCGLVIMSTDCGAKTRLGVASVNTFVKVTGPSRLGGTKNEMVVPSGATDTVIGCSS